ncbi:MAG: copper amine oxidase N-terminal domain-containing protein [Caldisericia bacterium]|nr:copper amine oxidase N-terminal domain-containing protein [Caldisericia bacterium]
MVRSSPAIGNKTVVFGSYDNYVYCIGEKVEQSEPKPDPQPEPQPKPKPEQTPEQKTIKLEFWIGKAEYTVDGTTKIMDVSPMVIYGSTFMPAWYLVEGIGGIVSWDDKERMVECKSDKHILKFWVSRNTANLDGVDVEIHESNPDIKPVIRNGRVLVPFRFLGESLGCDVGWDTETKRIDIMYSY